MKYQTLETYTEGQFCKIFSLQSFTARDSVRQFHRHSFYQIILLKKGQIRNFIDFEWRTATAPYISIVFPRQVHMMELSDDSEVDIIMFDQSVFCSALLANELREYNIDLQKRLNHITDINLTEWEDILLSLKHMRRLSEAMTMIKKMEIKFLIKIILLKSIEMAPITYPIAQIDGDLQTYQQFMEMLGKEFKAQMKVKEYCAELGITQKKLTSICDRYTGHTPLELVHERLGMELKRIVLEDGLTFKEIAYHLNFSSQSALNKFIENQYGLTPQKWKENLEISVLGKHKN